MILRRITEHVKAQNWTAVALDFVIVVTGVFIGIQVSNWNADLADKRQLDQQLNSVLIELQSNQQVIKTHQQRALNQIAAINKLRSILSGNLESANPDEVDSLLFFILRIQDLRPELTAYNELVESGGMRRLSGTLLHRLLTDWEAALSTVRRLDRDAILHRDNIVLDYVANNLSVAAMIEDDGEQKKYKFARSRFRNDVVALAESRVLDSMLGLRFALAAQIANADDDLDARTRDLIDALNKWKTSE